MEDAEVDAAYGTDSVAGSGDVSDVDEWSSGWASLGSGAVWSVGFVYQWLSPTEA